MPQLESTGGHHVAVLVDTPAHSQMAGILTYWSAQQLPAGTLVRVPLASRQLLGLVWPTAAPVAALPDGAKLRPISAVMEALTPLSSNWQALINFSASYYQRAAGEVALASLPSQLREIDSLQLARKLKKLAAATSQLTAATAPLAPAKLPEPSPDQACALDFLTRHSGTFLLFGATGSGKTEVFMRCAADALAGSAGAQVLVMVPEINLTPQIEELFRARFCPQYGPAAVVTMHSGMTPAQRLDSWLAAHSGNARIVLGTRMAIFASMPALKLIVVDEEHDPSYKSQEGARYSARDLAVYRGKLDGARVLLGSATPSLESWHHSRPASEGGRYHRLYMPHRIGVKAALPLVRRINMKQQPKGCVLAPPLLQAIAQRVLRGEQSMVFLNRRGYAPVLSCPDCDWKSSCPHCSAYRVFHKIDRSLRCHHCGFVERVPRACPDCGSLDIAPLGRGTERLEEQLALLLADVMRPDGTPVRIARIDADTTRRKGTLQQQLAQVHAGLVDVLVGTQMIAKGHDFRRITLVAAINPDSALFSSDFRSPERLFSLLMQAAGRAGRDAENSQQSEMWIQTFYPSHPLYEALKQHDYPAFAQSQLQERSQAGMPPFSFQALLRADARTQQAAQAFLQAAAHASLQLATLAPWRQHVTLYPAVPLNIQRVANVERAQMLLESSSRAALQGFLQAWRPSLLLLRRLPQCKGLQRWAIDVDPLAI